MKRTPYGIGTKLEQLLARHRTPSPERMYAAIDRVGRQIGSAEIPLAARPAVKRQSSTATWTSTIAATVALAAAVGIAMFWPERTNPLYRVVEGAVIEGGVIHANADAGAVLALADNSRIEMRSNSALSLERADDGIRIHLNDGGIIVNAAKQRTGRLYVQTKDITASVVGTVFIVNADPDGSRVAVIEGEVRIKQGDVEKTLGPGEQVATNPQTPPAPVVEEIAWSRNVEALSQKLEQITLVLDPLRLEIPPPRLDLQQDAPATRPANTPKWEVTSVRQCGPGIVPGARGGGAAGAVAAGGVKMDPSFLRVECMRIRYLIEDAYVKYLEADAFRRRWIFPVSGGPDWLDTDLYSIDARPENPPVNRQVMGGPMLQVLLEDRFKLRLRREVRQEPVYELRVADSGFKLQPLKEGECEARKRRISAEPSVPGNFGLIFPAMSYIDADGRRVGACGMAENGSPGARTVGLHGLPLYELTNHLSLDRIVLDKTGIKGLFDISVTYGTDVSPMGNRDSCWNRGAAEAECRRNLAETAARLGIPPTPERREPSGADTVFDAVRKQLGLELVPTIGPRTYYVVDHVERPGPN